MYHATKKYEKFLCTTSIVPIYWICIKIYLNKRPFEQENAIMHL
jgi:hypothetical protein